MLLLQQKAEEEWANATDSDGEPIAEDACPACGTTCHESVETCPDCGLRLK
jgi:rubrerythrin